MFGEQVEQGLFIEQIVELDAEAGRACANDLALNRCLYPIPAGFVAYGGSPDTTAPTITSSSTASVGGNGQLALALTADEAVTWTIVGGADQAQFSISGSTLRWVSDGVQNWASPADADANNTYVVTVRATDGAGNTTDQSITVTVTQPTFAGKRLLEGGGYRLLEGGAGYRLGEGGASTSYVYRGTDWSSRYKGTRAEGMLYRGPRMLHV